MNRKNFYLLCGIPGSGKSTWTRDQIETRINPSECIHISRDIIRFSILKENEEYFSHEDEVFDEFIDAINNQILYGKVSVIFVDATHLNEKARNKVLDKLFLENVDIYPVNFNIPLKVCLARNELRKDCGRAYVPPSVIRRMFYSYQPATHEEKYTYKEILTVGGEVK